MREREWEAAHTIWIWIDRSASMGFISKLAMQSKVDRALVIGLAAADLLVQGGERVGLMGLTRPLAMRNIIERFAEAMLAQEKTANYVPEELPPDAPLQARAQLIWISDFLSDAATIAAKIQALASAGARGHLVMIADPIEETFPFTGHMEFVDADSAARLRVGRAESLSRRLYAAACRASRCCPRRGGQARLDLAAASLRSAGVGSSACLAHAA